MGGCLLRLFWMMIGNVALAASAFGVAEDSALALGSADAIYWAVVGLLLAARYGDIRYFHGRTTDGSPATMAHWRRYAAVLVAVSTAIWLLAHTLAYMTAESPMGEGP